MPTRLIVASADQRHAMTAADAARKAGLEATLAIGAALSQAQRALLPRRLAVRTPVADRHRFIGAGTAKIGRRLPGIRSSALKDRWWLAAEKDFDSWLSRWIVTDHASLPVAYFHGFGGFAAQAQIVAKDLGMKVLNDVFEMHPLIERAIERRECDVLGISAPPISGARSELMARRLSAIASADVLVAGLPSVAHSLREGGAHQTIITGGYTVPAWAQSAMPRRTALSTLPPSPLRVLFVGQVHWYKGLHRALMALELLPAGSVEFTVVGATYPGPVADRILELVERVRRHTPVHLAGTLSRQALTDQFQSSHVLLFPSVVGGIGLATLEAAAHGLPVLVSSDEGVLRDGESCIVCGTDPASIAASLERVMEDPSAAEGIGLRASQMLLGPSEPTDYGSRLTEFLMFDAQERI